MVFKKVHYKKQILISFFIVALVSAFSLQSTASGWITFTSFKEVREMKIINDTLWAVTSGGLLAIDDPNQPGLTFNNQDGLGTNNLTDIIQDADGQKWIAGLGRLIRFDADNSRQFLFFDNDENLFPLYKVVDDGEFLWVGTDIGLVLFSKNIDGGQIQESYQLFGSLNPSPAVNDILLLGDSIWLATSNGLALADRSNSTLLKSPSNWKTFDLGSNPELESAMIKNVVEQNGVIYIATDKEIFRFDNPVFTPIGMGNGVEIHRMKIDNDTVFIYYERWRAAAMDYIDNDTLAALSLDGISSPVFCGINYQGNRWVASDGIYFNNQSLFEEFVYTGLPSNDVTDITINNIGELTAGFNRITAATLENDTWIEHNFWIRSGLSKVISDSSGNPMIGTIGNGLWLVTDTGLANYDENNSTLRGNSDFPPLGLEFVYVRDMATDGKYFYAVCYRAVNDYPVAIGDLSNLDGINSWDSIGVIHGLTDAFVVSIDLLGEYIVVGSESDGVYLCYVGDNPFNTDITSRHYTRENSLLISNSVRVVRFAPDGSFWAGTNFGLSRFDEGIERFRDVNLPNTISSDVTALEFDGRGNLWIGTRDGLAFRDAATGQINIYNSLNSDLPSNRIQEITVDKSSGNIYIATDNGYTFIPSQTGQPVYNVNEVIAFPNPFVIGNNNDRLNFNFGFDGVVSIYNTAGDKIIEMSVNLPWDGKNESGEEVASGVYIFLIKSIEGQIGKGKILLVRK